MTDQEAWEQVGCHCRQPESCRRLHGEENREAFLRGRRQYPGNPFPPMVYGYELVPESRIPSWAHRPSLQAQTVTVRGKDGSTRAMVVFRIPLHPPKAALASQGDSAQAAAKAKGERA